MFGDPDLFSRDAKGTRSTGRYACSLKHVVRNPVVKNVVFLVVIGCSFSFLKRHKVETSETLVPDDAFALSEQLWRNQDTKPTTYTRVECAFFFRITSENHERIC